MVRIEPLVQMAKHGNEVRGGDFLMKLKEGKQKVYKRQKEICPLCDKVVLYLTTHIRRTHKLAKKDPVYQSAMLMARTYHGKSAELMWDEDIIKKRAAKKRRRITSSSEESEPSEPKKKVRKKGKTGLQLLFEETPLPSDQSDTNFSDDSGQNEIPPTPRKTKPLSDSIRKYANPKESKSEKEEAEGSSSDEEESEKSSSEEDEESEQQHVKEKVGNEEDEEEVKMMKKKKVKMMRKMTMTRSNI